MARSALLFLLTGAAAVAADSSGGAACKNIPGDPGWPSPADWTSLNQSVSGRLIATVPLASVCHNEPFDNYDATACAALQPEWDFPQTQ